MVHKTRTLGRENRGIWSVYYRAVIPETTQAFSPFLSESCCMCLRILAKGHVVRTPSQGRGQTALKNMRFENVAFSVTQEKETTETNIYYYY